MIFSHCIRERWRGERQRLGIDAEPTRGWAGERHRRIQKALATAAAFGCLILAPSCADAAVGHRFVFSVDQAPAGTAFVEPGAVAVELSSGRVFVADPAAGVVDVFAASGVFVAQFGEGVEASGVAVDEATGDVFVADPTEDAVLVFKPNGARGYVLLSRWTGASTPGKEFGEFTGVAVDNSISGPDPHAGDVYVVDGVEGAVDIFKPKPAGTEEGVEGSFVGILSSGKLEEPNGVTVDAATGGVYVADSATGQVDVYSSAGSFERKLTGTGSPNGTFLGREGEEGNVRGVAVEETTGDVYVVEDERHVVSQFNGTGEWVGWIVGTPNGIVRRT